MKLYLISMEEYETLIYLFTALTTSFSIGPLSGALWCRSSDSFAFDFCGSLCSYMVCSYTISLHKLGISWSFHSWIEAQNTTPASQTGSTYGRRKAKSNHPI